VPKVASGKYEGWVLRLEIKIVATANALMDSFFEMRNIIEDFDVAVDTTIEA
jgi:hypothetical protein